MKAPYSALFTAYNNRGMGNIVKNIAAPVLAEHLQWLTDNQLTHGKVVYEYCAAVTSGKKPLFEIGKDFSLNGCKASAPENGNKASKQYCILTALHLNKPYREAMLNAMVAGDDCKKIGRALAGLDKPVKAKSDKPALSAFDKLILSIESNTIEAVKINRLRTALGIATHSKELQPV